MILAIRRSFYSRLIASVLLPIMISPSFAFGATSKLIPEAPMPSSGGSVDPNLVSTESSEMVNVSTGDFSYSIPLIDVGGYPITLSYNADVTMEQGASMVGLGWNISTGAINSTVRGLPDDFDGSDKITITEDLKTNWTVGYTSSLSMEIFGVDLEKGWCRGAEIGYCAQWEIQHCS